MLLRDDGQDDSPFAALPEDRRLYVELVASLILDAFDGGAWKLAKEHWDNAEIGPEERLIIWTLFDARPKERAFLKGEDRKYVEDYLRS